MNHCRLFNAKSSLYIYIKYIRFGLVYLYFYDVSTIGGYLIPNPFLYRQTVLFQTIQFSISTQFSSLWPIESTLSGASTPGQSGPGCDWNKGVLCMPGSLTFRLVSVISRTLVREVLLLCRDAVSGPTAVWHSIHAIHNYHWSKHINKERNILKNKYFLYKINAV